MKKIFSLFVAIACMVTFAQAQTGTQTSKKVAPKKETAKPAPKAVAKPATAKVTPPPPPPAQHLKKDGTPDKRFKDNQHLKKDGTPDLRYKDNKAAPKKG